MAGGWYNVSSQLPFLPSRLITVSTEHLSELQSVLDREIPICGVMGIRVVTATEEACSLSPGGLPARLRMAMPLDRNRNHQQTAFAGSLNSLCTIAGWGTAWLELRELVQQGLAREGAIVIRRGSIKYHEPVASELITARCLTPTDAVRSHFTEMLAEKGQTKLDLEVQIPGSEPDRPAVAFKGSYVVLPWEEAMNG